MSNHEARARRRGRERRQRTFPLVVGGALLLIALAGYMLLGPSFMSEREQVVIGTGNVKGSAAAPVEVEEWSDFQ